MHLVVDWTELDHTGEDERWDLQWCLYAYMHPGNDELLYLGKADRSSTWDRLRGSHKETLFDDIADEFSLDLDELRVLHGDIKLPSGRRRSAELLADIESLLIERIQPWGNIQSKQSRIARPGLRVRCIGDWPLEHSHFHDIT